MLGQVAEHDATINSSSYLATSTGFKFSDDLTQALVGIAGNLLAVTHQTDGFVICFAIAGVSTIISLMFLNLTREEAHYVVTQGEHHLPLTELIKNTLSTNRPFAWFLVSRILTQFGMMGISFYIVYTVRYINKST